MAPIEVRYYTDPACAASWGLEPVLRRLAVEFEGQLRWRYVMGGLAREFPAALAMIGDWLAEAERSAMPIDARLWLEAAPTSSYPACLAVEAASEQGASAPLLRALREGLLCRRRKLDSVDALVDVARGVGGLDVGRFSVDLRSHAIVELLGADLERAAAVPEHGRDATSGRVLLPSVELLGADGELHGLYGAQPYDAYRAAALAAGAQPSGTQPTVEQALSHFGCLATAEVAAICGLPGPRAAAELWRLAVEWRVRPERLGTGHLWSAA